MDFKQVEQTRRLVEVTALLALSLHGEQSIKVKRALQNYAFPLSIELQNAKLGQIEGVCPKCNRERCNDGSLTALRKTKDGIWCNRCVGYVYDL